MSEAELDEAPWHCLFCRMRTGVRLFRIPVCGICRDQLQDFVWVSLVLLALAGLFESVELVEWNKVLG